MLAKIRCFLRTYPYAVIVAYPLLHILLFFLLGQYDVERYLIESRLDAYIPFCEWFVIPYYIWYVYLFGGMVAFLFVSRKDFLRMALCTIGGMAICIAVCVVFPTAIAFRPTDFDRSNPLIWLVEFTYSMDQPWNVFPSMHCFGAIGITIAVWKSEMIGKFAWAKVSSGILCVLICLSTLFIKQHSILDLFSATVLAAALYPIAYRVQWKFLKGPDVAEFLRESCRNSRKNGDHLKRTKDPTRSADPLFQRDLPQRRKND